jgi:hypothetical protein
VPASRYLILLAGILGVFALFQPMIGIGRGPLRIGVSAYELSFGLTKTHMALDAKLPDFATKRISADTLQTRDDIKLIADASRGAALAYVPALLLLLIGGFTIWRKRTPRALAVVSGVLGLVSSAAWASIHYAIIYGREEEPALARLQFKAEFGALALLIAGVLALVAGVLAFRKVDA